MRHDVLILMDAPVVPGCIVRGRLLGAIQAKQKEKGGKWTRNDRLLAVATHAQTHQALKDLSDLRPHLLEEIKEFFVKCSYREHSSIGNGRKPTWLPAQPG